jgi:hypothetical protein
MLTDPNLIDAGANEIVSAPAVFCWLDAGLRAPVSPMQPELDRIAKSRRTKAATGIVFMPAELIIAAHFRALLNHSFMVNFFITAIVVCRKRGDYWPDVHLKDRGGNLHLVRKCGGKQRAALLLLCAAREFDSFRSLPNLGDSG